MMSWRPFRTAAWSALVVLLVGLQTVHLTAISGGAKSFTIHWNSSNRIFLIDNTDNIIDVNRGNVKFEYDQANLICPVYTPGTKDEDIEKYIIYNVSKDEYETCRITNPNPRIIAVCDKPFKLMYFTITFRPFTPQPGGLEFLPGHDYYFISTSTNDDLHRRVGGRCTSHNMKIVFKVWNPQETTSTQSTSVARPVWTAPPPTPPPNRPTIMPTSGTSTHTDGAPPSTPHSHQPRPTKKIKNYDNKQSNEVVKSQLKYSSASKTRALDSFRLAIATTALLLLFGPLR